jgi:hypothetical protein
MDNLTVRDRVVLDAMRRAMVQVAKVFDPALDEADVKISFDALGTTHHEAGTLWMGDAPQTSVTNPDGRFHAVSNAFVGDLSVLPTAGSANPMLPGIALARRLAKHLVPEGDGRLQADPAKPKPFRLPASESPVVRPEQPPADAEGFSPLFDGTTSFWRMAGKGQFFVIGDTLQSLPGNDLGLIWCTIPTPADFVLRLEWLVAPRDEISTFVENSGVFVRFPHPDSKSYHNPAWVPVDYGFEIQIDPEGRAPDGRTDVPEYRTGAVYGLQGHSQRPSAPSGRWNEMEIQANGQNYKVAVNGEQTADFVYEGDARGAPSTAASPSYIGVQAYGGAKAAFRNIRIKAI